MDDKERSRRSRARKRGEAVPYVKGGPKPGYKQTPEHRANISASLRQDPIVRFWQKVSKRASGCWEWTAGCDGTGYGTFWDGRMWGAHRYSWTIAYGLIPRGMCVLHRCDNPLCVNPAHLFLGTHQDNADDRESKGRGHMRRGTANGRSKLTEAAVLDIRRRYRPGNGIELAREYGVGKATVSRVVNRKHWGHVGSCHEEITGRRRGSG